MAISNLSVVSVPVSDQDRAKAFYVGQLGFTEQIDTSFGEGMRWVMLRPPGAATSVTLVTWFGSMPAGSMKGVGPGLRRPGEDAGGAGRARCPVR